MRFGLGLGLGMLSPAPFSPVQLFTSLDDGAIYRADQATAIWLVNSSSGGAVTVGGPIGIAFDTRLWGGLNRNPYLATVPEIVVNGNFGTGDLTGYSNGSTGTGSVTVSGGAAILAGIDAANRAILFVPLNGLVVGRLYRATFSVLGLTSGGGSWLANTAMDISTGLFSAAISGAGTQRRYFVATAETIYLAIITGGAGGNFSIDDISVKGFAGHHAMQSTAGARPTLAADAKGNPYVSFDGIDDALAVTFPNLGSNCTVAYVTANGVTILTGQTISGAYNLPAVNWSTLLAISRALSPAETAHLAAWLDARKPS